MREVNNVLAAMATIKKEGLMPGGQAGVLNADAVKAQARDQAGNFNAYGDRIRNGATKESPAQGSNAIANQVQSTPATQVPSPGPLGFKVGDNSDLSSPTLVRTNPTAPAAVNTQNGSIAPVMPNQVATDQPASGVKRNEFADSRVNFADDIEKSLKFGQESGLFKRPEARQEIYQRGKTLNLEPAQIDKYIQGAIDKTEGGDDMGWKSNASILEEQAQGRKETYQKEFGASDQKVEAAIGELDPNKFSPKQIASIRQTMASLTPEQRRTSVRDAKDKTEWATYNAKQNAAKRSGYQGEITSSTDFGKEATALIPKAKQQLQGVIDAAEPIEGTIYNSFGDWTGAVEKLKERRGRARSNTEATSPL